MDGRNRKNNFRYLIENLYNKNMKILSNIFHPLDSIKKIRLKRLKKNKSVLSKREYIEKCFFINLGYKPNLDKPKSFNEKLQWEKLFYFNSSYCELVDKVKVRDFVAERIGRKYLIPLFGVYDKPDEIDFDALPKSFVLKCNHNSGTGMYICKNIDEMNRKEVLNGLEKGLNEDYYLESYEWPYQNIERKILCEEYLGDGDGNGIRDYKFYCFDGVPMYFLISSNRSKKVKFDYFDINKNPLPFSQGGKKGNVDANDIINYDEMVEVAKLLSKGFPHVRVDLYNLNGRIYFGELTFFDSSGFAPFKPRKWDYIFGEHFILPPDGKGNKDER